MLIFGADVSDPAPVCSISRESRYGIKAFLIWTPVVIDNSLSEDIAIGKWLTTYSGGSSVYRFNACPKFPAAVDIIQLFLKFLLQQAINVFLGPAGIFKLVSRLGYQ